MKRVILTGATGFVGANLVRRLLRDGHELHLLLRPSYSPWRIETIRPDVHLHLIDLADEEKINRVVSRIKPDWVFHLAAHGAYSWQADWRKMVETNIKGTMNLVHACMNSGFEAFVNTGSSSEYGFKDHAPTEKEWLEPNSYYALTKSTATLFCRHIAQSENVQISTLRLYSVFGPYEEPGRLIPTLIQRGLAGKLPPLVNPDIARDYVFTEDVNEAYILAATGINQETGAVYNVGTGIQTTLREAVEVVRRLMDIPGEPEWGTMPNRQWDTTSWVADNQKIQKELGWRPKYSFEKGFASTVNWFQDNPEIQAFYS